MITRRVLSTLRGIFPEVARTLILDPGRLQRVFFIGPVLQNTIEYSVKKTRLPVLLNCEKCMFHIDVLAGEPTTCYVFRQSFKTLLKLF